MDKFNFDNREFIAELVEEKISKLKGNKEFEKTYEKLSKKVEELENELTEEQKNKFTEIVQHLFKVEEYYFSLAYSLGVKYGDDLKKL